MYGRVSWRTSRFAPTMTRPTPARCDVMTGSAAVSHSSFSRTRCCSISSENVGALSVSSSSICTIRRTSSSE